MSRMSQYITNVNGDGFMNWLTGGVADAGRKWTDATVTFRIDDGSANHTFDDAVRDIMSDLDNLITDVNFVETSSSGQDILFDTRWQQNPVSTMVNGTTPVDDGGFQDVLPITSATVLMDDNDFFQAGFKDYDSLLHETLHALGLGHPGPYNGASGTPIFAEDHADNTVMSYTGKFNNYKSSPQEFDLKSLYLLGYEGFDTGDTQLQRNFNGSVHEYWADHPLNGNEGTIHVDSGSGDVFVFNNNLSNGTFMTSSQAEADWVEATLSHMEFEDAFQYDPNGNDAVHRFFSTATNSHFYTNDDAEATWLQNNDPNVSYEGIEFYA